MIDDPTPPDPLTRALRARRLLRLHEEDLQEAMAAAAAGGTTIAELADRLDIPYQRARLIVRDGGGWRRWS